jgi:hypothetical protein
MPALCRLVDRNGELLADGGTIGQLKGLLRDLDSGRYTVDEISATLLPWGHSARRSGSRLSRPAVTRTWWLAAAFR